MLVSRFSVLVSKLSEMISQVLIPELLMTQLRTTDSRQKTKRTTVAKQAVASYKLIQTQKGIRHTCRVRSHVTMHNK